MTTPDDLDVTGLRALAEAARGPWWTADAVHQISPLDEADAAFIAAANPTTVLALLDALATERERREAAEGEVEGQRTVYRALSDLRWELAGERDSAEASAAERLEAITRLTERAAVVLAERDAARAALAKATERGAIDAERVNEYHRLLVEANEQVRIHSVGASENAARLALATERENAVRALHDENDVGRNPRDDTTEITDDIRRVLDGESQ